MTHNLTLEDETMNTQTWLLGLAFLGLLYMLRSRRWPRRGSVLIVDPDNPGALGSNPDTGSKVVTDPPQGLDGR